MTKPFLSVDSKDSEAKSVHGKNIQELSVSSIDYSRTMLREIDGQTINDLKQSIKLHGVLQPIVVFLNEKQRFEVVCGNHRLCAAKGIGLKTIPAIVRAVIFPKEAVILALNENIQRFEMNPLREGEIYSLLVEEDKYMYSIKGLAEKIGKSHLYVEGRIRIFKSLHPELREKIGKELTLGNAIALSRLSLGQQLEVFGRIERNSNIPRPDSGFSFGGGGTIDGLPLSPYCSCEKCGAKHLKGVSVKVE